MVESKQTSHQNVIWVEMNDSSQITHIRQVLLQPRTPASKQHKIYSKDTQQNKNSSETAAAVIDVKQVSKPDVNSRQKQKYVAIKSSQFSITKQFTGLFQSSVKSEKLASFNTHKMDM